MAGKKGLLSGSQGCSPEGMTATYLALAARRQVQVSGPSPRTGRPADGRHTLPVEL